MGECDTFWFDDLCWINEISFSSSVWSFVLDISCESVDVEEEEEEEEEDEFIEVGSVKFTSKLEEFAVSSSWEFFKMIEN